MQLLQGNRYFYTKYNTIQTCTQEYMAKCSLSDRQTETDTETETDGRDNDVSRMRTVNLKCILRIHKHAAHLCLRKWPMKMRQKCIEQAKQQQEQHE